MGSIFSIQRSEQELRICAKKFLIDAVTRYEHFNKKSFIHPEKWVEYVINSTVFNYAPRISEGVSLWRIVANFLKSKDCKWSCKHRYKNSGKSCSLENYNSNCDSCKFAKTLASIVCNVETPCGLIYYCASDLLKYFPKLWEYAVKIYDSTITIFSNPQTWRQEAQSWSSSPYLLEPCYYGSLDDTVLQKIIELLPLELLQDLPLKILEGKGFLSVNHTQIIQFHKVLFNYIDPKGECVNLIRFLNRTKDYQQFSKNNSFDHIKTILVQQTKARDDTKVLMLQYVEKNTGGFTASSTKGPCDLIQDYLFSKDTLDPELESWIFNN